MPPGRFGAVLEALLFGYIVYGAKSLVKRRCRALRIALCRALFNGPGGGVCLGRCLGVRVVTKDM